MNSSKLLQVYRKDLEMTAHPRVEVSPSDFTLFDHTGLRESLLQPLSETQLQPEKQETGIYDGNRGGFASPRATLHLRRLSDTFVIDSTFSSERMLHCA